MLEPKEHATDIRLALGIGILYLITIFIRDVLITNAIVRQSPLPSEFASSYEWTALALIIPVFAVLMVRITKAPYGLLRDAISKNGPLIGSTVFIVLFGSIFLNNIGIWPFAWRFSDNPAALHTVAIFKQKHWVVLSILTLRIVFITPFVEEIMFRFGVLRAVYRRTNSRWLAIVISSLVFTSLHIEYWLHANPHMLSTFSLLLFAVALGYITVNNHGNIRIAITAHAMRNATELGSLFYTIAVSGM